MGPLVLKAQNILLKKHLQRQASRLGLRFDEFMGSDQTAPLVLVAEHKVEVVVLVVDQML